MEGHKKVFLKSQLFEFCAGCLSGCLKFVLVVCPAARNLRRLFGSAAQNKSWLFGSAVWNFFLRNDLPSCPPCHQGPVARRVHNLVCSTFKMESHRSPRESSFTSFWAWRMLRRTPVCTAHMIAEEPSVPFFKLIFLDTKLDSKWHQIGRFYDKGVPTKSR